MNLSEAQQKEYHALSFQNEKYQKESSLAGCFYCLTIFPVSEVVNWVLDKKSKTAICPHCSIDSVIFDGGKMNLSLEMLKELNKYWF